MEVSLQNELIDFMFRRNPDGSLDTPQCLKLWFGKDNNTDIEIESRFGQHVASALDGAYQHWTETPRGCLALMILIDQFPRNIYRHTIRSFAGDAQSRELVYSTGHDWLSVLSPEEAIFVPCLILTHQENVADQACCLAFYAALEPRLPSDLHIFRTIFEEHHRIIALCGTFPHRDHYYNRQTSQVGKMLLDNPTLRFDLPLCTDPDGKIRFGHDPTKLWKATQKAFEVVDRIDALVHHSARRRSTLKPDSLTPARQAEYAEIFKAFDKDGSAFLEIDELTVALANAGHNYTSTQLQEAVDEITGQKNSPGLTFEQFANLLRVQLSESLEERMRRRFELFDSDRSGTVDLAEFTACVQAVDSLITTSEAAAMFKQCDRSNSGVLNLQDFLHSMERRFSTVSTVKSDRSVDSHSQKQTHKVSTTLLAETVAIHASPVSFDTSIWEPKGVNAAVVTAESEIIDSTLV